MLPKKIRLRQHADGKISVEKVYSEEGRMVGQPLQPGESPIAAELEKIETTMADAVDRFTKQYPGIPVEIADFGSEPKAT